MLKKRVLITICITMIAVFGTGGPIYAEPGNSETAAAEESTEAAASAGTVSEDDIDIEVAASPEEASKAVPAAENDKFLKVDLSNGQVRNVHGEPVPKEFQDIYGKTYDQSGLKGKSKSKKREKIKEMTDDTELYSIENIDGNTVELQSRFATCRLLVKGVNGLNTFGADSGTQLNGLTILKYETEEQTADAYEELCDAYGRENVMIDLPFRIEGDSTAVSAAGAKMNWSYAYMGFDDPATTLEGCGGEVTIAVLDSGVNSSHEVFARTQVETGYDFVNVDSDVADDDGHGTFVASVIAQSTGANVSILPVKVLDNTGSGSAQDMMFGMIYAEEQGADIVNLSFGEEVEEDIDTLDDFVLDKFSGIMIAAAGNEGSDIDSTCMWPACSDRVFAVSALKYDGTNASFDSAYSNYGNSLDYTAPGSSVYGAMASSNSAYGYDSGTSFAAPHMASAAALVMSNDEDIDTRPEMAGALNAICKDEGDEGFDKYCGNGCPILTSLKIDGQTQKRSIADAAIESIASRVYSGSLVKPEPTVIYGRKVLVNGRDYTLSYSNNKNVGTATVTITGSGRYTGSLKGTFKIIPKKTSIRKITGAKRALTVKWQKQSAKMSTSRITGYQVQTATNKSFTASKKTATLKGYSTVSKKIKSLKAKKKYYVRVRTYKTVKGTKYYSDWSAIKSIKTK